MTTQQQRETALAAARAELCQAIGLSQAQFADPNGDGLDSGALIAAIDTFEATIRAALQAPDARVAELEAGIAQLKDYFDLGQEVFAYSNRWPHAVRLIDRLAALEAPAPAEAADDLLAYDREIDGPSYPEPDCWGETSYEHYKGACRHFGGTE